MSKTVSVTGMACGGCEEAIEDALAALDGVETVNADHESDMVSVTFSDTVSDDELASAIESAGYEMTV